MMKKDSMSELTKVSSDILLYIMHKNPRKGKMNFMQHFCVNQ